jgi:hypothetical protein
LLLSASAKITESYFLSGRSDTILTGFEWCPSHDLVPFLWEDIEPNNAVPLELVMAFNLDQRTTRRNKIFADTPPSYLLNYACEVISSHYLILIVYNNITSLVVKQYKNIIQHSIIILEV